MAFANRHPTHIPRTLGTKKSIVIINNDNIVMIYRSIVKNLSEYCYGSSSSQFSETPIRPKRQILKYYLDSQVDALLRIVLRIVKMVVGKQLKVVVRAQLFLRFGSGHITPLVLPAKTDGRTDRRTLDKPK
jgi:hypothetical protein